MRYLISFFVFCFICFNGMAQLPIGVPTQKINGWAEANYYVPDSGAVISKRDTSWRPRFPGTMVTWFHAGVDTVQWFWNGAKWGKVIGAAVNLTWQQSLNNSSVLTQDNSVVSDGFNWKWHNTDEFGVFKEVYDVVNSIYYSGFYSGDVSADSTVFRLAHEDGEALIGHFSSVDAQRVFANPQEARMEFVDLGTQSTTAVSTILQNVNLVSSRGVTPISTHQINIYPDSIEIKGDTTGARRLRLRLTGLPISSSSTDSQLVINSSGRVSKRATVGGGTVTSVGLTMPTAFTVTSTTTNPITTSGTFNVTANGTSAQYVKGNGVLGTTDTSMIPSFFTKVRSLFSGTSPISYSSATGAIGINIADVSGTLGAATFDGSYFTTNGSGLISLKIPGSGAASCSPCKVTFNAVGQATTVASNSVNNGLSLRSDSVQLGQTIGAGGSPATLTHNTEIPLGAYDLRFLNIGTNNANAFALYAASNKNDSSGYVSFRASDGTELNRINVDANFNTFFGENTGINAVSGGAVANTFIGAFNTGAAVTTGKDNAAFGVDVMQRLTTGRDNIGIGNHVMTQCTTCNANTSIGYTTQANATTANYNIAIGGDHLLQAALQANQTGNNNIAIGYGALGEAGHTTNNQSDRIAIGFKAFGVNLVGFKTIGIGDSIAMRGASVGAYNVLLGGNMFSQDNNARVVGDSNVIIGSGVGVTSEVDMGSNNIILGNSTQWGASFSNSMLLGFGLTNNISNIVRLGRTDQNVIVGVTANQADNGYKHQVYGSGFFRDSLKIGNIPTGSSTDSVLVSRSGVVYKVLQSALASGTIYVSDGTLTGNRVLSGANKILTLDTLNYLRVNAFSQVFSWPDKTSPYSASIIAGPKNWQIGYTPTPTVYSKGAGVFIDTNNNVGLGVSVPTTAPLYATGLSAFVNGFQNQAGNFLRVDNISTNVTLTLDRYFLAIDATGGSVAITLPAASTAFGSGVGLHYVFFRTDASVNTVTISRAGADTINGATSFTLTAQYQTKHLECISSSVWAQY